MYTKEESRILSICGWSEKELEYKETKIFDVKSSKKENLLFLLTKVNNNEIVIEFCVPDTNGEKMKVIFDRVSQKLSNANNAEYFAYYDWYYGTCCRKKLCYRV